MTTLLIAIALLLGISAAILILEAKQARTICSLCGSLECDGEHEETIEEIALAKLDRGMQEQREGDLLAPWLRAFEVK